MQRCLRRCPPGLSQLCCAYRSQRAGRIAALPDLTYQNDYHFYIGIFYLLEVPLTMLATIIAYQYAPLRLVEDELPDVTNTKK